MLRAATGAAVDRLPLVQHVKGEAIRLARSRAHDGKLTAASAAVLIALEGVCRSVPYHLALLAEGARRWNLDGTPAAGEYAELNDRHRDFSRAFLRKAEGRPKPRRQPGGRREDGGRVRDGGVK